MRRLLLSWTWLSKLRRNTQANYSDLRDLSFQRLFGCLLQGNQSLLTAGAVVSPSIDQHDVTTTYLLNHSTHIPTETRSYKFMTHDFFVCMPCNITVYAVLVLTARCYEERGIAMASRLSVPPYDCPFVTLRYRGQFGRIGWNTCTSKIISRRISLGSSVSADFSITITDLLHMKHPTF